MRRDFTGEYVLQVHTVASARRRPHRQHGRQHALALRAQRTARQEGRDRVEDVFLVAGKWQVILPRQFDERRSGDARGEVTALLDVQASVAGAVQHERRHLDQGENVANVDFCVHSRQCDSGARAGPHA